MKSLLFGLVLALYSITSSANDCDHLYPHAQAIKVNQTVELCNSFFVTVFSTKYGAALFSSEYRDATIGGGDRENSFRADKRLPEMFRATNEDYRGSGFDRGHLVPAGDATTTTEMRDTFLLSNMTPQDPILNRGAWKELEEMIRNNVSRTIKMNQKSVHIITGAIYSDRVSRDRSLKRIGKVLKPLSYFKIVYMQNDPNVLAWVADNAENGKIQKVTVAEINKRSGYNLPIQ